MMIAVENEAKRLGHSITGGYKPFIVTAYRSATSRSPIMARFDTAHDAFCFVEQLTGLCAVRYVQQKGFSYQVETFTGKHEERFDWCQYQTPKPSIDALLK